ncbi:BMP family lipoprotein [Lysinibacillus fusiformis]|uniref:BMP family lipoprotein n=1 Tax=Lysinibacillus fusiformis TaxID=28031 RepID=UPI000885A7D7|nr:BMP family ABC transporter substrate-binding protein [Lysinibacillus fusiformis]SCX38848.1 nucleoside-binding protein [Lysinibacillus fusiformis]SDB06432.1 nucleoside-binding protein [Lysinibacillus fusiformis]SFH77066.1 nucleoside-binding protein [Lysinibacillus fusiformis]SFT07997.1 nucleoside-binding protein [Lysinibacillus fusiformis]
MKKLMVACLLIALLIAGCSSAQTETSTEGYKIGVLLSDAGLGDESFNDSAFKGLEKARDELGILFDYKEAPDGNYEEKLQELVEEKYDIIIGLGFSVQEALEKTAKQFPEQQFVLIDGQSDVNNIISITFKEQEGSFLVGMVAAMTSKTGKIGFIGGADAPVIHHFENGFIEGARNVNPNIEIMSDYAGTFDDTQAGAAIADKYIQNQVDFIYHAAGFTGFGAIKKAEEMGIYAAGVDIDQFYIAEKTVVTSMLKNVDHAVFQLAKTLVDEGKLTEKSLALGLAEQGVGLADIRVITLTSEQQAAIEKAREAIVSGSIKVSAEKRDSQ